jgi:hypothetical protein
MSTVSQIIAPTRAKLEVCLPAPAVGDVDREAPGLVAREQLARRPPPRLILVINVTQRLPAVVAHDKAGNASSLAPPSDRRRYPDKDANLRRP